MSLFTFKIVWKIESNRTRKLRAKLKALQRQCQHQRSLSTVIHGNRFCYPGGHVRSAASNRASNRMHLHKQTAMGPKHLFEKINLS